MQFSTEDLRRGAFGQPSVPFLLSRRAHLLTTPKGRWYCLRQPCALRGGCGFCGSLMDNATSRRCCCHCPRRRLNVLLHMHNKGMAICHPHSAACLRKSATGSFIADMGSFTPPIFFLRKRNKKPKDERTVRTNGYLPLGSKGGQQRYGAFCGCRFRLSELY